MNVGLIALGAALGAPARYLLDRFVQSRHRSGLPWGTLAANGVACLVLGLLGGAGSAWSPHLVIFLGTGFCATLSTYSTFGYETMRLSRPGSRRLAVANVVVSLVVGIGAAALGWAIGTSLVQ